MFKRIVLIMLSIPLALVLSCATHKNSSVSLQSGPEKTTELIQNNKETINQINIKPLVAINIDEFTKDTQAPAQGSGDGHFAIVWWIPNEFWVSVLNRDNNLSETNKKMILDMMASVSLLAVVQADVSPDGSFTYYSKESILKKMIISHTEESGKLMRLTPMHSIGSDLKVVLGVFKPILEAAMGNLGKNFHFYVLNDKAGSEHRLIDPYKKGLIKIQLMKKSNDSMNAEIELPLNCLFVPRKCPNGKDAHITWKYCPWTGKKL